MIILWGSNARETHPIFFHHVLKAVHRGAKLYVRRSAAHELAQWADGWLGLDVGTDIALANTVAREIIHAGLDQPDLHRARHDRVRGVPRRRRALDPRARASA